MSSYFELAGKHALVTGGGAGLGVEFATALAEAGASVVICGRRAEPLEATRDALQSRGLKVEALVVDITLDDEVETLREHVGDLDILVNNAGYSIRTPWLDVPRSEWDEVMSVNVGAPFRLTQVFAPHMVKQGWGRVINIASVYGTQVGNPALYPDVGLDIASYFVSKHALLGLTKHLAVELGGTGVTVNAISPGAFPAPDQVDFRQEALATFAEQIPSKRLGAGEDLRTAVLYLASVGSSYVNGQNVVVDGGWSIW